MACHPLRPMRWLNEDAKEKTTKQLTRHAEAMEVLIENGFEPKWLEPKWRPVAETWVRHRRVHKKKDAPNHCTRLRTREKVILTRHEQTNSAENQTKTENNKQSLFLLTNSGEGHNISERHLGEASHQRGPDSPWLRRLPLEHP